MDDYHWFIQGPIDSDDLKCRNSHILIYIYIFNKIYTCRCMNLYITFLQWVLMIDDVYDEWDCEGWKDTVYCMCNMDAILINFVCIYYGSSLLGANPGAIALCNCNEQKGPCTTPCANPGTAWRLSVHAAVCRETCFLRLDQMTVEI